jgi:hypothetical protein
MGAKFRAIAGDVPSSAATRHMRIVPRQARAQTPACRLRSIRPGEAPGRSERGLRRVLVESYSAKRSEVESKCSRTRRSDESWTMRKLVAQSIRSTVDHLMLGLAHVQHALAVKTTTLTTQSGGGPDEALQSRRAPTRAYSRCPSRQNDKGFSHRCFVALIAWIWARGGPSSPSNFKLRARPGRS